MVRWPRLALEQLEARCTPVTWGNPWPDPGHLTVSFAPDGAKIGDQVSSLFSLLNGKASTATWQQAILRAAQTWAVNANINLNVASDNGADFGTAGAIQGDTRFGDIRLGAMPLPPGEELAIASPFETLAGTWSGDIRLNSSLDWGVGGNGQYDLYTVMLHEFGHVFGMGHSPDTSSVMYADYVGPRTGLGSADITDLQAIYGPRTPDGYEGAAGNGTLATASPLTLLASSDGSAALTASADVSTLQDKDVYSFTTLLTTGSLLVNVQTSGFSLLTPRVTVYNSSGLVVGSAVASSSQNGGLALQINGAWPLSRYYVKVESGSSDVFGIGSYQLQVKTIPLVNNLLGGVTGTVSGTANTLGSLLNNDLHTNDSFLTATLLSPLTPPTGSQVNYTYRGSISDSYDVDYYRITAPPATSGATGAMTVMTWGLATWNGTAPPAPRVQVYDAQSNPVASEVLINDGYSYAVQIVNPVAGATYYVKLTGAPTPQGPALGNYDLNVNYSPQPVNLQTLTTQTITASNGQVQETLHNFVGQLFHFVLSSQAGAIAMTITDQTGKVLLTLGTKGEAVSANVFLKGGTYSVHFTGTPTTVGVPMSFLLRGDRITDPNSPEATDPTETPSGESSTGTTDPYEWDDGSGDDTTTGGSSDPITEVDSTSSSSDGSTSTDSTSDDSTTSMSNDPTTTDPTATGSGGNNVFAGS